MIKMDSIQISSSAFLLLGAMVLLSPLFSTTVNAQVDYHPKIFERLRCRGTFDVSILAGLSRVCEECYNLYRKPEVEILCRENCFRNEIFPRCVEALTFKVDEYIGMVNSLAGTDLRKLEGPHGSSV